MNATERKRGRRNMCGRKERIWIVLRVPVFVSRTLSRMRERAREREHEEEDQLRRELDRAEWEAGGRPSGDTGDATPQFGPKNLVLAH